MFRGDNFYSNEEYLFEGREGSSPKSPQNHSNSIAVTDILGQAEGIGSTRRQLFTSTASHKHHQDQTCNSNDESSPESSYAPPRACDTSNVHGSVDTSSDDSFQSADIFITDGEVQELISDVTSARKGLRRDPDCNEVVAREIATEDYWSSLFADPSEPLWDDVSIANDMRGDGLDHEYSFQDRGMRNHRGGLPDWSYASPFERLEIGIEEENNLLGDRFLHEATICLDNVVREAKLITNGAEIITATSLRRMSVFDVFLPERLLEKLKAYINRALKARKLSPATVPEIKGFIITHVLAASYGTSVSILTAPENRDFFFQTGVSGSRYLEIWSAMSCTTGKRQQVQAFGIGWSNKPVMGNELITELEQELAATNRSLVYVPGRTIFSLDDDHQRLRSRAVTDFTNLSQINIPKKALGPVNNAVCSAMTSAFIACHYSRPGEKIIHVWERLVQLIQGAATTGSLRPMTDAIFAADRGYNARETIKFINERLGAIGIGTHKRSLDFPFVFREGPIRKKHKGMAVSEKGCRAVYSATRRPMGYGGKSVQAVVYRESCTGRIAAFYHNNQRMFGAQKFSLIPKKGYRKSFKHQTSENTRGLQIEKVD